MTHRNKISLETLLRNQRMVSILRKAAVAMLPMLLVFATAGCRSPAPAADRSEPYRPVAPDKLAETAVPAAAAADPVSPPPTVTLGGSDLPQVADIAQPAAIRLRLLQAGDRLEVFLHGIPNPKELAAVVDEDGYITMPHIGQVQVAGKTGSEVERLIERRYIEEEYYRSVTCVVIPPRIQFFVRGEVKQPGRYPLTRDVTLLQAIAMAGGYTDHAQPRSINILRGSLSIDVNARNIERGQDPSPPIEPGDIIVVPRRRW